jgi:hypothetical protein
MRIGIGIPNTVLDASGETVLAWARRAEERGFSTLATIDRIAYPSYDSLTVLTAAAAVTGEIGPSHEHSARAGLQPGPFGQGLGEHRSPLGRPPHSRTRRRGEARRLRANGPVVLGSG